MSVTNGSEAASQTVQDALAYHHYNISEAFAARGGLSGAGESRV
jgi:hypothetical protein